MELTNVPGIYRILNTRNGKFYVGSTKNLRKRKSEHFRLLRNNKHFNRFLQSAYRLDSKYFKFEVLELVNNLDVIFDREQYYIDKLCSYTCTIGYNLTREVVKTFNAPRCRKLANIKRLKTIGCKPFSVFTKEGKLVGSWTSQTECLREMGINIRQNKMICAALRGRQHTVSGHYFIYNHELHTLPKRMYNAQSKLTPMFIAIDRNGKEYGPYQNQRACAEELNIDYKKISLCLKGTRPRHKGYTFKHI